ncbi:MAG: FAD-dependent oxidoreductase [bacterium]|nr:FAD-dependent oxidoreductase [bacterium]
MKAIFIEKVQVTPTDWSFRFQQPEGFKYKAGQYSVIRVPPMHEDYRNNVRTCSTSSSPTEEYLQFTFTIRNTGFKDTLMHMDRGFEVEIYPAVGKMTLEDLPTEQLVMIAGGIGVAPYRGMIKYAFDTNMTGTKIKLLYSDKVLNEIAFREEFDFIAASYSAFEPVYTLTRHDPSDGEWNGETGRIDSAFISRYVEDIENTKFMVCGPEQMVRSGLLYLGELGVPRERIAAELFTGF